MEAGQCTPFWDIHLTGINLFEKAKYKYIHSKFTTTASTHYVNSSGVTVDKPTSCKLQSGKSLLSLLQGPVPVYILGSASGRAGIRKRWSAGSQGLCTGPGVGLCSLHVAQGIHTRENLTWGQIKHSSRVKDLSLLKQLCNNQRDVILKSESGIIGWKWKSLASRWPRWFHGPAPHSKSI